MTIQWPWLLLALALLLPPLPLASPLRRYLTRPRKVGVRCESLAKQWQNWIDLIRAGLGVYLLMELAIVIDPEVKGAGMRALLLEGGVLAVALAIQMVRISQGIQLFAPVFYLCGVTLVLAGYTSGGFAVFVGWLFAIGGKNPAYQLPVMGVALGIAGYVLGLTFPLMLNCGLIFLPLFVAFLFRRQLLFVACEPPRMVSAAPAPKPASPGVKNQ